MNSRFFHTKASNHRKKNWLVALQNDAGEWVEGYLLDAHIVDYFQAIFQANNEKGPKDFLLKMGPRIIETMSRDLSRDFTKDELKVAPKKMHPTKASELDGMTPYSSNATGTLWARPSQEFYYLHVTEVRFSML